CQTQRRLARLESRAAKQNVRRREREIDAQRLLALLDSSRELARVIETRSECQIGYRRKRADLGGAQQFRLGLVEPAERAQKFGIPEVGCRVTRIQGNGAFECLLGGRPVPILETRPRERRM